MLLVNLCLSFEIHCHNSFTFTINYQCFFFQRLLETWKLNIEQKFNPTRGFFRQRAADEARVITLTPPIHPLQHRFHFQPPSSSSCMSISSLSSFPSPESHSSQPRKIHSHSPPPIPVSCPSRPAAPCQVKWTMPVSEEPRVPRLAQPGSAQLSVLNLLCDYCQSETPPPRRSAMMGTIWHRAQPAMKAGIREQRRYRNPGWGKDTEAREKYC